MGIDLKEKKAGFLIQWSSNTLYATKTRFGCRKFDEYSIDRSIYVVASEQNLHFKPCISHSTQWVSNKYVII